MSDADDPTHGELTIDELATEVGMTVRNVRAYASRGLIPAPRIEGRTGYYGDVHAKRLLLVRELVDRGYTLAAVEKALLARPDNTASRALDLIDVLEAPLRSEEEPELISTATLLALAGVSRTDNLVERLEAQDLLQRRDDDQLVLLQPTVVRAGAQAIAIGLDVDTVLSLLPVLTSQLRSIADRFVDDVRREIWQPFVGADMPDDQWEPILRIIGVLMPVAGQTVLAVFRRELGNAIHRAMGAELDQMAERQGG